MDKYISIPGTYIGPDGKPCTWLKGKVVKGYRGRDLVRGILALEATYTLPEPLFLIEGDHLTLTLDVDILYLQKYLMETEARG